MTFVREIWIHLGKHQCKRQSYFKRLVMVGLVKIALESKRNVDWHDEIGMFSCLVKVEGSPIDGR
jgi:hypothetical protein